MIRIDNATGPSSRHVNGEYEPTNEQRGGFPVFKKKGDDDVWLEYCDSAWFVCSTEHRGTAHGWAFVDIERPCLPHDVNYIGSWQLLVNSFYKPVPQLLVTLLHPVPKHVDDLIQRAQRAYDTEVRVFR